MNAIDFVTRTRVGAVERGSVAGEDQGFLIDARAGNDISLNIRQADVRGYDRAADDLLITLADGRVVVLEGYFADGEGRLFLSAEGQLNQVSFVEAENGALFAQYGPTETWGKWSPSDELIFVDEPSVVADVPGYYGEDEEVSMLGAGLLGGLGATGIGLGGAGLAGLGVLGVLGGDDGDGGGGGGGGGLQPADPTVDDPDGKIDIGGGDEPRVTITGTGEPGDEVSITIDETTNTTTIGDDGTWEVTFEGEDFPEDGVYTDVPVTVTHPDDSETVLDGPSFEIDTTPPAIEVEAGTVALGDIFNAEGHEDGVTISGTAEVGSTVTITVGEATQTMVVDAGGSWSFDFDSTVFPGGEYTTDITITAKDSFGNTTVINDSVEIDTISLVDLGNAPLTGDDLIGQGEYDAGVTLSGTSQAGSTVAVTIEGVTHTTTAGGDGSWSVTFGAGDLPAGTYTTTATIVATDLAGNSASTSHSFNVDTEISLDINTGSVGGDGTVNAGERADGVLLTGTAEPGSTVEIMVSGTALTATVGADGSWQVTIPTGLIPEGETNLSVTATATDLAGNSTTTSGSIAIDTTTAVTAQTAGVEGDGVVNAAEHGDGVTLTGTAEPGATVMVSLGSVTKPATVAADGSWSVSYASFEIPTGEQTLPVTAVSTDMAGNAATATGSLDVDTLVRDFSNTSTPGGADGVLNAEEAAQGLTLTGTTEVGSTVMVTLGTVTLPATVDAAGNWSVTYSAGMLPSGETTVDMVAVATDAAGNTDTLSQSVRIDTDAGILTISPAPVEGDDIVNFDEASDGVILTGTSNPGELVTVTMNGVSHTVLTNANGVWTAPFGAHEIAPGTYTAEITATITDSAGNTLTRTDSVRIDTQVENFAPSVAPIEGEGVINAAEASNGVTLTGTTEVGGSVQIVFEGMTYAGVVDANGNWTVDLPASAMLSGETSAPAEILTTDAAGNTASTTISLTFDTLVTTLDMSNAPVTPDGVINAAEADAGVTLTGQVEAGSTVMVTFGGVEHVANVDAGGNWTVDIPSSSIPRGTTNATVLIEATDAAGNVDSVTESIAIDTEAPNSLAWEGYGRNHDGVDEIRTEISEDVVSIGHVVDAGGNPVVVDVEIENSIDVAPLGVTYHTFADEVPDGSHLVVTATDDAGNTTGNYLVTDDPTTNEVTMTDELANTLSEFQIESIDLEFAEDSHLTITEAQITALSSNTDTLVVHGGADDSVTITGATATGTTTVDGETFNTFSLGDATLLIDDDITNVNVV